MNGKRIALIIISFFISLGSSQIIAKGIPAFPGAEGAGAYAKGGRGGKILFVANLNDSGQGSFREACEMAGPRIIIFQVAGIIELQSTISIKEPFITIAGQAAPGDGICLKNYGINVNADDVIIRYIRVRPGDESGEGVDALSTGNSKRVIIDHCSASWSVDECMSITGKSDGVTLQWCIIAEGLYDSVHPKGPHSMGSLLRSDNGKYTIHHCIYSDNYTRNPRPGNNYKEGPGVLLDYRNNVMYDWGGGCGYAMDESVRVNYVGNYLRPGPSTLPHERKLAFHTGGITNRVYAAGNEFYGYPEGTKDNWLIMGWPPKLTQAERDSIKVYKPFETAPVHTHSAKEAYEIVLEKAGATIPMRDTVDQRIIAEIRNGTGHLIDTPGDVGGWPEYLSAPTPKDSDNDGMPDSWEIQQKLNPNDPSDNNLDSDNDGYTNIEEYLNKGEFQRSPYQYDDTDCITNSIGMTLKLIQPGSFQMGSKQGDADEANVHKVTITKPFYMGVFEVTQKEWESVMDDNRSEFKDPSLPIINVNFDHIKVFCEKLSKRENQTYRLPTEAEWEYACRAGTTTEYHWGDDFDGRYAWYKANSGGSPQQGGFRYPNPLGLYDIDRKCIGMVFGRLSKRLSNNRPSRSIGRCQRKPSCHPRRQLGQTSNRMPFSQPAQRLT